MKRLLLTVALCVLTVNAYAAAPMQGKKADDSTLHITSLQNNLTIDAVYVNRGNCTAIVPYFKKGGVLNYGEQMAIIAIYNIELDFINTKPGEPIFTSDYPPEVFSQLVHYMRLGVARLCPVLELVVDNGGEQWTFSWENK